MQSNTKPNSTEIQVPTFEQEMLVIKESRIKILETRIGVLKAIQDDFVTLLTEQREEIAYWKQQALLAFSAQESEVI